MRGALTGKQVIIDDRATALGAAHVVENQRALAALLLLGLARGLMPLALAKRLRCLTKLRLQKNNARNLESPEHACLGCLPNGPHLRKDCQ